MPLWKWSTAVQKGQKRAKPTHAPDFKSLGTDEASSLLLPLTDFFQATKACGVSSSLEGEFWGNLLRNLSSSSPTGLVLVHHRYLVGQRLEPGNHRGGTPFAIQYTESQDQETYILRHFLLELIALYRGDTVPRYIKWQSVQMWCDACWHWPFLQFSLEPQPGVEPLCWLRPAKTPMEFD